MHRILLRVWSARVVAPQGVRLTVSPRAAAEIAPPADAAAAVAGPPRPMSYG
ncbi:hypothetical protein ACFYPZ_26620 [Streptomyces sp. NPDC005506]|uniref:hypothetical protein n=1 Tax=unclassified Streptomyces TaxID=2593676 RepID=UPI003690E8DA